jgi:hypothetical protein
MNPVYSVAAYPAGAMSDRNSGVAKAHSERAPVTAADVDRR